MTHETFHYKTISEFASKAESLGVSLALSDDMACLAAPLTAGPLRMPNRLAVQPMEGADAEDNGAPSEKTYRRYRRFAEGGAGLIWFEAVSGDVQSRSSTRQLLLRDETLDDFKRLVERTKEAGLRQNGFAPVMIMQANHSGRYAKPFGTPRPLIAYHNPILEEGLENLPFHVLTDDELQGVEVSFGEMARLASLAGFDGVDVKCCHRYLTSELLSAFERPGRYGGSFENRTRLIRNCVLAAKSAAPAGYAIASRMNAYDGFPYPWGFGTEPCDGVNVHLDEAKKLAEMLAGELGACLINVTIGNPYKNPHVNRPYDHGNYVPDEHPISGLGRIMDCARAIQAAIPDTPVVASGFSYARAYSANLAAGMVASGAVAMAGFGRMAFANPDFASQILRAGKIDPAKVCVTCGQCAVLLRHGVCAGCIVRDKEMYKPYTE